jgi:hypothetical protein
MKVSFQEQLFSLYGNATLNEINPNLAREVAISHSISQAINHRAHIRRLFLQANAGMVGINYHLAGNYEFGHSNFPIDYIQAKKHCLRAGLRNTDPERYWFIQANLKIIDHALETGILLDLGPMVPNIKKNPQDVYSQDKMQAELSKLEAVHGKASAFEKEVSQPYSLKDACKNYVASHVRLFKLNSLPKDLENEITQFRETHTPEAYKNTLG